MQGFRKLTVLVEILCLAGMIFILLGGGPDVFAGIYVSSDHGNATDGVNRGTTGNSNIGATKGDTKYNSYAIGNCAHCHELHASLSETGAVGEPLPDGPLNLASGSNDTGAGANDYDLFNDNYGTNRNQVCYYCHEYFDFADEASPTLTIPQGYGREGVYQGQAVYEAANHDDSGNFNWPNGDTPTPAGDPASDADNTYDGNCLNCHNPHGVNDGAGSPIASLAVKKQEALCYVCHDGSPAAFDIKSHLDGTGDTSYHNVGDGARTAAHTAGERQFGTMHVECEDCHNPHAATAANPIKGTFSVKPPTATAGATPTRANYTAEFNSHQDEQYKVCYKCHTDWATGTAQGSLNVAIAFNTANDSYHWVEHESTDTYTVDNGGSTTQKGIWQNAQFNLNAAPAPNAARSYAAIMMPRSGFTYTDANLRTIRLLCSDCHGPITAGGIGGTVAEGPHGNTTDSRMLKRPANSGYTTWSATVDYFNNGSSIWCFNCHHPSFTGTGFSTGGANNQHTSNHDDRDCQVCHLANPHGQTGSGTSNQRRHLLSPSTFTDTIDDGAVGRRSGAWTQGSGHSPVIPGCT